MAYDWQDPTDLADAIAQQERITPIVDQVFVQCGDMAAPDFASVTCLADVPGRGDYADEADAVATYLAQANTHLNMLAAYVDQRQSLAPIYTAHQQRRGLAARSAAGDGAALTAALAGVPYGNIPTFAQRWAEHPRVIAGDVQTAITNQVAVRFEVDGPTAFQAATVMTTDGVPPENLRIDRIALTDQPTYPSVFSAYPTIPTTQAAVPYLVETITAKGAAERAEGAAYGEADLSYAESSVTIRGVGVIIPITDEQLADVSMAQGLISGRLTTLVNQRGGSQLINGSGVAPNLQGLLNVAGLVDSVGFTPTEAAAATGAQIASKISRLRWAIQANGVDGDVAVSRMFIHPTVWSVMESANTNGQFLLGGPASAPQPALWGIPVSVTPVVPYGLTNGDTFGVAMGDFAGHASLYERSGVIVEVGMSGDDFATGKRRIRVTRRLAPVYFRPSAFGSLVVST